MTKLADLNQAFLKASVSQERDFAENSHLLLRNVRFPQLLIQCLMFKHSFLLFEDTGTEFRTSNPKLQVNRKVFLPLRERKTKVHRNTD